MENHIDICYKTKVEELNLSATKFIIKLNSMSNFARSDIDAIRNLVEKLILNPVIDFVAQSLNEKPLSEVLSDAKGVFSNVNTQWRQCAQYRFKQMLEAESTTKFLEEWPEYANPSGIHLVRI